MQRKGGGMVAELAKRRRERKQKKRIEEVVHYALGHKVRVEILILLNEAIYTTGEVSTPVEI
jgi:hypothetical protein